MAKFFLILRTRKKTTMEFCISSKVAKFFVQVIVLITIVFLVRVESGKYRIMHDVHDDIDTLERRLNAPDTSDHPMESSAKRKNSLFDSSRATFAPQAPKPLLNSSKTDFRKPSARNSEWMDTSRQVTNFLSPNTLSHPDVFRYLLLEVSKLSTWKVDSLGIELDSRLKADNISESVMPYARALRSIIDAMASANLQTIRFYLANIHHSREPIPPEVSSPPAFSSYGLFSSDVIDDPDAPFQLINKLMEIPKSEIPNVIILLQDYVIIFQKWRYVRPTRFEIFKYQWYAENLISFLKKDSLLDNLRLNMAEIQRLSGSNLNSPLMVKLMADRID